MKKNINGKLYGIGVGPGDPELITLKAMKFMKKAEVIACPAKDGEPGVAYGIAQKVYPNITDKECLLLNFPMEKSEWEIAHKSAAEKIINELSTGKDVAMLTLGDTGFFSTFFYVAEIVKDKGFEVEIINGIPSFCAIFAKLKIPACLGDEPVLITAGEYRDFEGTLIIMKAGRMLKMIKEKLIKEKLAGSEKRVYLVENCGMDDEKAYDGLDAIPDKTGYFSILIIK